MLVSRVSRISRKGRSKQFLCAMETVVPRAELKALIEPHYPKAGKGRQPVGLGIMLRIYFLQHWLNLSDPGAGDALYESRVLRSFSESIWAVLRPRREYLPALPPPA